VGERTRDPQGAHVDFVSTIRNPIGVKLGPTTNPDDALRLIDRLDPEAPTVVFCHAGSRSSLAAQQLIKAGFQKVANLRGGLQDWYLKGLPMPEPLSV